MAVVVAVVVVVVVIVVVVTMAVVPRPPPVHPPRCPSRPLGPRQQGQQRPPQRVAGGGACWAWDAAGVRRRWAPPWRPPSLAVHPSP